jgi:hypothetical protein
MRSTRSAINSRQASDRTRGPLQFLEVSRLDQVQVKAGCVSSLPILGAPIPSHRDQSGRLRHVQWEVSYGESVDLFEKGLALVGHTGAAVECLQCLDG